MYDIHIGLGLFTMKTISNGDIISVFNGYHLPVEALSDTQLSHGCLIAIDDEVILDCYSTKGWMCMASLANSVTKCWNTVTNRKAVVNAYIHIDSSMEVSLRALRQIDIGEEILCSYGKGYIYPTFTDNVSSMENEIVISEEEDSSDDDDNSN
jgi:hypothetical protein